MTRVFDLKWENQTPLANICSFTYFLSRTGLRSSDGPSRALCARNTKSNETLIVFRFQKPTVQG